LLSLVISVAALAASAAVGCHCWLAARRRARRHDEWARLSPALRSVDAELDRVWAVESVRLGRHH
jgi:hypothetical protein